MLYSLKSKTCTFKMCDQCSESVIDQLGVAIFSVVFVLEKEMKGYNRRVSRLTTLELRQEWLTLK